MIGWMSEAKLTVRWPQATNKAILAQKKQKECKVLMVEAPFT